MISLFYRVVDCTSISTKESISLKEILDTYIEWSKQDDRVIALCRYEQDTITKDSKGCALSMALNSEMYSAQYEDKSIFDLLNIHTFRCRCGMEVYYQGGDFKECLGTMVEKLDTDCWSMFLEVNVDGEWIPLLNGEYGFITPTDYGKVFRKDLEMLGATGEFWDLD